MSERGKHTVASPDMDAFFRAMHMDSDQAIQNESVFLPSQGGGRRLNLDPEQTTKGLAQLVLTVIKLLHELMERQAIRRMDSGTLTEAQVERLGLALMRQSEELQRLQHEFELEDEDLNLDLGPLGKLL
jgi:hypothetical protein